ncbi:MAG TPA: PEP-CTERM sorting domain-containing protein [Candidatus Acidoferrales bacterium]|jgi:hypothetical protein|nr:PEP-CTERM sorting domain-containing protein [Candidatus Acidoferrales bacterium]
MPVTSRFASVAALGLLVISSAAASSLFTIPVVNFSFEIPPAAGLTHGCGPNCSFSTGSIPGWVGSASNSGEFRPGALQGNTTWFNTLTNGNTILFDEGPTISQTVGATVVPGDTYTLMVDLGQRKDLPLQPFRPTVDLLIGGAGGTTFTATGTAPVSGGWSTFVATYTGLPGDAGKSITIQLLSTGSQGEFDNVRLSGLTPASSVPEPTGVTLLGLGLAGLLVFAKRQRAS